MAAVKKVNPERIIAGALRYRDDPNRDPAFTKYPGTWLRAEAWNNGPLPARNRGKTEPIRGDLAPRGTYQIPADDPFARTPQIGDAS